MIADVQTQGVRPSLATLVTPKLDAPPLSLYVHLPWCVRKCPYCDFNSHAAPTQLPEQAYIDALLADLTHDRELANDRSLISIFFGGGTPSLFDPDEIGRFLEGVRALVPVSPDAEVTLEANPGTIEHGRFAGYRAAGVNRVSLGAQSFSEPHLKRLGRIHAAEDTGRAVDELLRAGIENFNLDLMYGLPEQSLLEARADIERAIQLAPTHISHYQLTLEPGTVFYHRPPPLPDGDLAWDMQQQSQELLAGAGYVQYEVSAYARAGRRSQHNLNYWRFGDYFGVGAGAHGKITTEGEVIRTARLKQPRTYLALASGDRLEERRVVAAGDLPLEFMLNALRLTEGFEEAQFESRTGLPFARVAHIVNTAVARGLLVGDRNGAWHPTELGRRFLNELQALFLDA